MDRRTKKLMIFLSDQKLLAAPFQKGNGFCVLKQTRYSAKLNEISRASQFENRKELSDDLSIKTEKLINSNLHQLLKQGKINEKIYHRLRTTRSQPARLFGLAEVQRNGTPLRPVLSVPGSSYENLNKLLFRFFETLPGKNIETNSKYARTALEATELDEDELVVSLRCCKFVERMRKRLKLRFKELYSSDEVPQISGSAMKKILRLSVSNVHFKCNKMWYSQSDGLALVLR